MTSAPLPLGLRALPAFLQPRTLPDDPPLPEVDSPLPATPADSGPDVEQVDQADDRPPPPPPSLDPPAAPHTPRSSAGSSREAGKVLAGLVVIALGITAAILARRGRGLRQPTPPQLAEICDPVGRIAARHLPLDLIGPDLADATEAAAAVHGYVLDGPMVYRTEQDLPETELS